MPNKLTGAISAREEFIKNLQKRNKELQKPEEEALLNRVTEDNDDNSD